MAYNTVAVRFNVRHRFSDRVLNTENNCRYDKDRTRVSVMLSTKIKKSNTHLNATVTRFQLS